ncbi:MAG: hypothetical protein RJA22_1239 [Verrucomicrobiota bacterium]|jgi:uncharacterized RDD family membrane protein YckC/predicted RNA-binding Zn-ribbon protein involved in translation (DUF1610 family)
MSKWYYGLDGRQQGPVDDAQLDALIASGTVRPNTLVWREGMPDWRPLREARPTADPQPATPTPAPLPVPGDNAVRCSECGDAIHQASAVQYGTVWVCPSCRPAFLQRCAQGTAGAAGAGVPGSTGASPLPFNPGARFAGFWVRFVAKFIDGIILLFVIGIPLAIVMLATGTLGTLANGGGDLSGTSLLFQVAINCVSILASVAYNTFFIAKYGATPGKMALGLRIVRSDGSQLTPLRAFGRAWAEQLSNLTCYIGHIIAAFDTEKRALQDHICDTRVVYK